MKRTCWAFLVALYFATFFNPIPTDAFSTTNNSVNQITDCTEDDLTTLQNQINEAASNGGGNVKAKACLYTLEEPLRLKSGVSLQGEGIDKTVFKIKAILDNGKTNTNKIIVVDRTSDVSLSNFSVDGDNDQRPDRINDPHAHSLEIAWSKNFQIKNLFIKDSAGASIAIYRSQTGVVENTNILNSGSNGILAMMDVENVDIYKNTINGTLNQNGIFFMYQNHESSKNINIKGNTIRNTADYGIEVGHTTHEPDDEPHRNIVVNYNTIENSHCTGIGFRTVSDGEIGYNKIIGYAKHHDYGCNALFVEGRVSQNENVNITSNFVKQTYPKVKEQQYPYQQAIYVTGMKNMDIQKNYIEDSWNDAITILAAYFNGSTPDFPNGQRLYRDIRVNENIIKNTEANGAYFTAKSTNNEFKRNYILDSGKKATDISNESNVDINGNIQFGNGEGDNVNSKPSLPNPPNTGSEYYDDEKEEEEGTTPPPTPRNFTFKNTTSSSVDLYWEGDTDENSFVLLRGNEQIYSGTNNTFSDHSLQENTSYTYTLYSIKADKKSSEVSLTIQTPKDENESEGENGDNSNLWENGDLSPLHGFIKTELRNPGIYQLSFESKSASASEFKVYMNNKFLLDQNIKTTNEWEIHTLTFSTKFDTGGELLFTPQSSEDVFIKNIELKQIQGDSNLPEPEPLTELEKRLSKISEAILGIHEQNKDDAIKLVTIIEDIISLKK